MKTGRPGEPELSDVLDLKREILASALVFAGVFPTLRYLTPRLSTEVQSLLVWAGAAATWLGAAWYCYHRGNFLGGWILAFGPVFAYATNLIVQMAAGFNVVVLIVPAVAAAAVSVLITGLAYLAGRGVRLLVSGSVSPG